MPFFSDEDPGEEQQPQATEQVAEELTQPVQAQRLEEEDDDPELEDLGEDVERRLEVAALYKLLLQGGLFEGQEGSVATRIVEKRVKAFVKAELKALIGMGQPMTFAAPAPAASEFTSAEVQVLKAVAAKVLDKGSVPTPTKAPATPAQLRSRTVPPPPAAVVRPTIPGTTPKKPAPAAPVAPKPAAKATPAPAPTAVIKEGSVLSEYETEKGYRIRDVRRKGRLIKQYFDPNGKLFKERDITPQSPSRKSIPPPSKQVMEAMSQQHAIASVSSTMEDMAANGHSSLLAIPGALQGE
jgi:hypothetical protein